MPKARRKPAALPPIATGQEPTERARFHGRYVTSESRGGMRVWTNEASDLLGDLHCRALITKRQLAAGLAFAETHIAVWGSPSRRDSTQPVIGGQVHESDSEADRWAKQVGRLKVLTQKLGPRAYSQAVSVAVYGDPLQPFKDGLDPLSLLRGSLDTCAETYGVDG